VCVVCINWTKFLVRVSRTSFLDGELGSSVMGLNWTKFLVRVSRTSFLDRELGSSVMGFILADPSLSKKRTEMPQRDHSATSSWT